MGKNSSHFNIFTPTPWVAWATNIRCAPLLCIPTHSLRCTPLQGNMLAPALLVHVQAGGLLVQAPYLSLMGSVQLCIPAHSSPASEPASTCTHRAFPTRHLGKPRVLTPSPASTSHPSPHTSSNACFCRRVWVSTQ